MKRVVFDQCIGWLHEGPGSTGIVLCAPLGHEYMWSHRALRHLADDLASAGMPVLRFDYPGCGDAGGQPGPDWMAACTHGIVTAVATLRAHAGVERVVLCGLRAGAMLAVLAAEAMASQGQPPLAGVALLAPPVTGRAYLRELRALQASWRNNAIPDIAVAAPADGALEVLGYRFPADTVALLDTLRLDRRPCPAVRVLLLDPCPSTSSPVTALAAHYRCHGAQVTLRDFERYDVAMRSAETAGVPDEAWQQIADWLGPSAAVSRRGARPARLPATPTLRIEGALERSVWLDGGNQIGVLATPADGDAPELAVLFPNTGGNHHVGDCRMFVTLSRQLARAGVAALRLDVSALGDSPRAVRQVDIPALYGIEPPRDVVAAVAWLRAQGYRRVVVAGVCSGAYLALQAALGPERVDGLVLANLLKFRWDADDGDTTVLQSTRVYLAAARNPAQWLRVLRGDVNPWPHAAALARRLWSDRRARNTEDATHTAAYARAAMATLQQRGVCVDLLYGAGDIGLDEARACFGPDLGALAPLSLVQVQVPPCLDHALFLPDSRRHFAAALMRHLAQRQALPDAVAPAPLGALAGNGDPV